MKRWIMLFSVLIIAGCGGNTSNEINGEQSKPPFVSNEKSSDSVDENNKNDLLESSEQNKEKILNTELNSSCGKDTKHLDKISLQFIKENVKFGASPDDVINFWGRPCGSSTNALNTLVEWRYDFPEEIGYVFEPSHTDFSFPDEEGIKVKKMKLQLFLGWLDGKLAYYDVYYLLDEGIVDNEYDAPEELKEKIFE